MIVNIFAALFLFFSILVTGKTEDQNIKKIVGLGELNYQVTYVSGRVINSIDYTRLYSESLGKLTTNLYNFTNKPTQDSFDSLDEFQKRDLAARFLAQAGYDYAGKDDTLKIDPLASTFLQNMSDKERSEVALLALESRELCTGRNCPGDTQEIVAKLLQQIEKWNYNDLSKAACQMTQFFKSWDPGNPNHINDKYSFSRAQTLTSLLKNSPLFDRLKNTQCGTGNDSYHIYERLTRFQEIVSKDSKLSAPQLAFKNPLPNCAPENAIPFFISEFENIEKQKIGSQSLGIVELRSNSCFVAFSIKKTGTNKLLLTPRNSSFRPDIDSIEVQTKQQLISKLYGDHYLKLPWVQKILNSSSYLPAAGSAQKPDLK